MPSRIQVNPDAGIPELALKPAAQVADTYIRPQGQDSQGAQLAQALAGFAPDLARFGNDVFQRQSQSDLLKGQQAARDTVQKLDASRKSYADGVRDGTIPAHLNPWMKKGYYEELGRTYAGRFKDDLGMAVDQNEKLQDSIEPTDFRKFTADFESQWLDKNVPADIRNSSFQVGYGNRRDAAVQETEGQWSAQTEQKFVHRIVTQMTDDAQNFISDAMSKKQTPEQIGTYIRSVMDDKHALGFPARMVSSALVDAISNSAIEQKDPTLFKTLLEAVPAGKDGSRLSSSYATHMSNITQQKVYEATREDWATTEHNRTEASRTIDEAASQLVLDQQTNHTDPTQLNFSNLRQQAVDNGDSALDGKLQVMQKAALSKDYQDDPELVKDLSSRFHTNAFAVKESELVSALDSHKLSLATFSSMSNALRTQQHEQVTWNQTQADRKTPGYLDKDGDYQNGAKELKAMFGNGLVPDTPALDAARDTAVRELKNQYYDRFLAPGAPDANLPASSRQRSTAVSEMVHDLAQRYTPPGKSTLTGDLFSDAKKDEWKTQPADIPERVGPILDELESGKRPSPSAVSLLTSFNVPLTPVAIRAFIDAQRKFIPKRQTP